MTAERRMDMTNEEAIIDIRENIQPIVGGKSLDLAISALEKQVPKNPLDELSTKKYTNEDIISSLKIIATTRNCNECKIRNCKWGTCNCSQITANAALDLINRQNAEIERLESANDEKFRQWDMLAEKAKQHYADLYNEAKDILKAEAYKEFAEKLENICEEIMAQEWNEKTAPISWSYAYAGFIDDIDNLLKEMVGEKE